MRSLFIWFFSILNVQKMSKISVDDSDGQKRFWTRHYYYVAFQCSGEHRAFESRGKKFFCCFILISVSQFSLFFLSSYLMLILFYCSFSLSLLSTNRIRIACISHKVGRPFLYFVNKEQQQQQYVHYM